MPRTQIYLFIIRNDAARWQRARPYNALRLAVGSGQRPDAQVRIFLIGYGVNCAVTGQTPEGYYNVERMLKSIARRGEVAT